MADERTQEMRARLRRVRARTEEATVAPKATLRFAVYALVGVVVGAAVAAYQWLALDLLLHGLLDAPLWVQAVAPGIGLGVTALVLRTARTTPARLAWPSAHNLALRSVEVPAGADNSPGQDHLVSVLVRFSDSSAVIQAWRQ